MYLRIFLLGLASLVMFIGLLAAMVDYSEAFYLELNYFHALRGLAWNIGAYTLARTLVWWAMATRPDPQPPDPANASHAKILERATSPKSANGVNSF